MGRDGEEDPLIGRSLAAGKLFIEQRVGVGGAGTVYRARHRDLQMHVAVKLMHERLQRDPAFCKRFHDEALSASRLDHANLTRVYDFGQEPDGLLYIAMEFLDGRSLRELLDAERRVDFARAAQIMIQVCSGLTHAHARSIVHRDIKPENVVLVRGLDEDGRETEIVKVCDFGIAHRSAVEAKAELAGTAEYISPEQFEGDEPGVQSDVYACGVVLYELLVGEVPIPGDFPEIVKRVLHDTPEPPSKFVQGLDARVDRLVMKAISKDREIRHASVRELRTDLKETADAIALFSAGGYWEGVGGNVGGAVAARPSVAVEDGTPDWLERDPGMLASIMPTKPTPTRGASAQPGPVRPPAASQVEITAGSRGSSQRPAVRASMPSYADIGPVSVRPGRPSEAIASAEPGIMSGSHISMTPAASSEADDIANAVDKFVRQLMSVRDPEKFGSAVSTLGPKIANLIEQGHIAPAWRLCSVLDGIAREPHGLASRAEHAQRALEIYDDGDLLKLLARKALDVLEDRDGAARKLVARAGNRGALVLYSARVNHSVFEARERFVATLQEIGVAGNRTLRAGLEKLETRLQVPGALWLAEDLLKAVPQGQDDELGQIIARYAKSQVASLALLATAALPRAWGLRARSTLIAQIHHKEDDVAIAAIKRLRQLGGIDTEIVGHLRTLLAGTTSGRPAVRLAAIESLVDSTREARPAANQLLVETLDAAQGNTPDVDDVVVLVSSTIVAIGGDVTLVAARWRSAVGFMRTRLEAILRRARVEGPASVDTRGESSRRRVE